MATLPKQVPPSQAVKLNETRRIIVRNLVLPARIGIYHHERSGPQRVRLNIELTLEDLDAPINDDFRNVVSYEDVV